MKYLLVLIFVIFLNACGEKNSSNIEGTYIASDKSEIVIKDGMVTLKAHGVFPARQGPYKVINNRIEFTWNGPGYFLIKDDKTISIQGLMDYKKQ